MPESEAEGGRGREGGGEGCQESCHKFRNSSAISQHKRSIFINYNSFACFPLNVLRFLISILYFLSQDDFLITNLKTGLFSFLA